MPIDFSHCSVAALDYAVAVAFKLDARVTLLNAVGVPRLAVGNLGVALAPSMINSLIRPSQATLDKLTDARRPIGSIADALVGSGDPRDVIDCTALELGADLIIMGTHGRSGVKRALLGGVAEATADRAVLMIRSPERLAAAKP